MRPRSINRTRRELARATREDELAEAGITVVATNPFNIAGQQLNVRRLGCFKLSYEMLATCLGVGITDIQYLDVNVSDRIVKFFHTDEAIGCFDLAEGQTVPETNIPNEILINRAKSLLERFDYTVTPPEGDTHE